MDLPVNQIICGDCLEILKDFPSDCVDLVVTSPPYDNLRDYHGIVQIPVGTIVRELWRVVKDGGIVVWIVGDAVVDGSETGTSFITALTFISPPKQYQWKLHDTMIYEKSGIPFPEQNRYNQAFEYMFIFSKGKPKTYNLIKEPTLLDSRKKTFSTFRQKNGSTEKNQYALNKETRLRHNIWKYATGYKHSASDDIAFEHPAIFPEQLAADHIRSWSNADDLVLDPMNGSGTSTKMAAQLKRRYIGIDISEEYCEIARQRLEAVDTGVPVTEQRQGQMPLWKE